METAGGVVVRHLGRTDYREAYDRMRRFNAARTPQSPDELWLTEHPPVYTVGVSGRARHLPRLDNGIPVEHVDRGGQITYHGPGQAVAYTLLDLHRRRLKVGELVRLLEQAVIDTLAAYNVVAERRSGAPGVYVGGAKIAALGLRVRRGCCYHGLAFNIDMDLSPFQVIDPCGYPGLAVTDCRSLGITASAETLAQRLTAAILGLLPAAAAYEGAAP